MEAIFSFPEAFVVLREAHLREVRDAPAALEVIPAGRRCASRGRWPPPVAGGETPVAGGAPPRAARDAESAGVRLHGLEELLLEVEECLPERRHTPTEPEERLQGLQPTPRSLYEHLRVPPGKRKSLDKRLQALRGAAAARIPFLPALKKHPCARAGHLQLK
jgi:hypothetical protein